MRIFVNQNHINRANELKGVEMRSFSCPVAQSLLDAGYSAAQAGRYQITAMRESDGRRFMAVTPPEVRRFMDKYDSNVADIRGEAGPFPFDLEWLDL